MSLDVGKHASSHLDVHQCFRTFNILLRLFVRLNKPLREQNNLDKQYSNLLFKIVDEYEKNWLDKDK